MSHHDRHLRQVSAFGFMLVAIATGFAAEPTLTGVNPALLYYQSFIVAPELNKSDEQFLWGTNDWHESKLPARFGELIARYDNQFLLVRQAASLDTPCDWGLDKTQGPLMMMPHLARAKGIAQMARLRAKWYLQQRKYADARQDLVAAFVLGRNVGHDRVLISSLVQIAIEAIVCSTVAENFGRFPLGELKSLVEGIESAPDRTRIASCALEEKELLYEWLIRKTQHLQVEKPGNDQAVLDEIGRFLAPMDPSDTNFWPHIQRACGGTSKGIVKVFRETSNQTDSIVRLLEMPCAQKDELEKDASKLAGSNPFTAAMLPAFVRGRLRELNMEVGLSMMRAAYRYRVGGERLLNQVQDPCGSGPFKVERFVFQGTDRGFRISSANREYDAPQSVIFIEKDGPPFRVYGRYVGTGY